MGMFHPFVNDASVKLVGAEAGGEGVTLLNYIFSKLYIYV